METEKQNKVFNKHPSCKYSHIYRVSLLLRKITLNKYITQAVKQLKAGLCADGYSSCTLRLGELKSLGLFILSHLPSPNVSLSPHINCLDLLVITHGKRTYIVQRTTKIASLRYYIKITRGESCLRLLSE